MTDRRLETRLMLPLLGSVRATLRPGYLVEVLNVSAGGALVQGGRQMRPGARVHVQLSTETRILSLMASVLRCRVFAIDPEHGVIYQGALRFDDRCDLTWEDITRMGSGVPAQAAAIRRPIGNGLPVADMRMGAGTRSHAK